MTECHREQLAVFWVHVGTVPRSDAFYEVCKDPAARDSAVVQATKVQGLVGARILDHTTPEEVLVRLGSLWLTR